MPSYWPDKPHKPAYRTPLNKIAYSLYRRFGLRSHFWAHVWSEREVFRILRVLSRQLYFGIPSDLSKEIGRRGVGGHMSLQQEFIRDGKRRIIGSVTTGYQDSTEVVRNSENGIIGKVNHRFSTTRDADGKLVSINTPDPGLLISSDDE
jgi:hypothetical protein